ncbi:MAG: hypothetical protein CFE44_00605 [Burkholderiales bacterium PBB4]|nr:MAG: hypothetical protein CFE44_00605 [Burkholderiales bacterium PBB4]
MSEQLVYVGLFLALFACIPWALKWGLRNTSVGQSQVAKTTKIVSMVGLGPSQRLVTVEVGPEHDKLQLVLGVTAQQIVCLHKFALTPATDGARSANVRKHLHDTLEDA